MSRIHPYDLLQPGLWTNEGLDHGIIDLYVRRAVMVANHIPAARSERDAMISARPSGRAFTAQPSFPPDPRDTERNILALREQLAGKPPTTKRKPEDS